jgi:hypothetical protein
MEKYRKIIIVVFSLIMIMSLYKCSEDTPEVFLQKSWSRSYEEEISKEIQIYRPSNYKEFPPSRYREVFEFEANNVCRYLILAENDGHYMENGKWEYNESTKIIKIFNSNSEIKYEFEVVELTNDLLKLR